MLLLVLLLVLTSTGENNINVTSQQTMFLKRFLNIYVKKFNKYFKNIL